MNNDHSEFRPGYSWLVVILFTAAYILSNIDRQLISVLIVPIQRDLNLSDTDFGLLQGLAYGLFYAGFCVPIAGLSDRASRSAVIATGLAVWSAATLVCGFARSFVQLFFARAVVGAAESSLGPAVYSLLADIFPRGRLGRALGVFSLGPFLGSTAAFMLGGGALYWLGENGRYAFSGFTFHTWHLIFLLAGVPGLLLALAIALVVKDPRTRRGVTAPLDKAPFKEVLGYLIDQRAIFFTLLVGFNMLVLSLYAMFAWAPAFLVRTEGVSSAEAGIWLGSIVLFGGGTGALCAGFLMDALIARQRSAASFEVGMFAASVVFVSVLFVALFPFRGSSFFIVALSVFFGSFALAPAIAGIQSASPPAYRSRISSLYLIFGIVVQALVNVLIGVLNDVLFQGPNGIQKSLTVLMAVSSFGAIVLLAYGRGAVVRMKARAASSTVSQALREDYAH